MRSWWSAGHACFEFSSPQTPRPGQQQLSRYSFLMFCPCILPTIIDLVSRNNWRDLPLSEDSATLTSTPQCHCRVEHVIEIATDVTTTFREHIIRYNKYDDVFFSPAILRSSHLCVLRRIKRCSMWPRSRCLSRFKTPPKFSLSRGRLFHRHFFF